MRRLLIILVTVLVLALAADRVAVAVVEAKVASRIQSCQGLATRPEVTIGGFPFLTQAAAGRFGSIDVAIDELAAPQGVAIGRVHAHLTGAGRPSGSGSGAQIVPVDSATLTGVISYAALDRAASAKLPGPLSVQFAPVAGGDGDQLTITGTWSALIKVQISSTAQIAVRDGLLSVSVVPGSLRAPLPTALREEISRLLARTYTLPPLPLGMQASAVRAGRDEMSFAATGRLLQLPADDCAQPD
jgi:LmeA-like phospholipid-binding